MPQKEWPKFVNLYTKLAIYHAFHTKMALIPGGIRAYINGIWLVVYVIKEEVRGGIMAAKHQRMCSCTLRNSHLGFFVHSRFH